MGKKVEKTSAIKWYNLKADEWGTDNLRDLKILSHGLAGGKVEDNQLGAAESPKGSGIGNSNALKEWVSRG